MKDLLYKSLEHEILQLGWARPGSVVQRFVRCGKHSCSCMAKPPRLHGPYWQWTHKVKGKTVTRRLTGTQAQLCEQWLANHRRLKAIVREMEARSLQETNRLLDELRD